MAPRHARQRLELVGAEHLAARIRRRADYDGARSRSDRRFQRVLAQQRWGGQVADALAEVDPADALALARHAADLRLRQALQPIRDAHQGMDSNRAHLMTDTV